MATNALRSYHAIVNGDMSGDITSGVIDTTHLINHSVQFTWTGTAVGDFQVQITNNPNTTGPFARTDSDWVNVAFDTQPAAAGSADSIMENLSFLRCAAMRFFFDRTSGTGTLQAFYSGINA